MVCVFRHALKQPNILFGPWSLSQCLHSTKCYSLLAVEHQIRTSNQTNSPSNGNRKQSSRREMLERRMRPYSAVAPHFVHNKFHVVFPVVSCRKGYAPCLARLNPPNVRAHQMLCHAPIHVQPELPVVANRDTQPHACCGASKLLQPADTFLCRLS
jgi:hypothetical protein